MMAYALQIVGMVHGDYRSVAERLLSQLSRNERMSFGIASSMFVTSTTLPPSSSSTPTLGDLSLLSWNWTSLIAIFSPTFRTLPDNFRVLVHVGWRGTKSLKQCWKTPVELATALDKYFANIFTVWNPSLMDNNSIKLARNDQKSSLSCRPAMGGASRWRVLINLAGVYKNSYKFLSYLDKITFLLFLFLCWRF